MTHYFYKQKDNFICFLFKISIISIFLSPTISFCTAVIPLSPIIRASDLILEGEFVYYKKQNYNISLFYKQGIYSRQTPNYKNTHKNLGDIANAHFKINKVLRGEFKNKNIKLSILVRKGWFLSLPYFTSYEYEDWNPILKNQKGLLFISFANNSDSIVDARFLESKTYCYEVAIDLIENQNFKRKNIEIDSSSHSLSKSQIIESFTVNYSGCSASELTYLTIGDTCDLIKTKQPLFCRIIGSIDSIKFDFYDTLDSSDNNYLPNLPISIMARYKIYMNIKEVLTKSFIEDWPICFRQYYIPGKKIPLPYTNKENVYYLSNKFENEYSISNGFLKSDYFKDKRNSSHYVDTTWENNYRFYLRKYYTNEEKIKFLKDEIKEINEEISNINKEIEKLEK